MNEIRSRRIIVASSLNKMSTDQLGNRVIVRGGGVAPPARSIAGFGQIFKDDMKGFPSFSDICFMLISDYRTV
jgi:hypothetical protein